MDSGWRESRWGRRDRNALGAAIRAVAGAQDLASAAELICEGAAALLRADRVTVVRIGDGGPRIAGATGAGAERIDDIVAPTGALAAALRHGDPREVRSSGAAEVAAPIDVEGRVWGAIVAAGAAGRIPRHAHERLAPFADLVSLAAAAHEDRLRLASLAGTDPLTGLGNRRTFDALLVTEFDRAVRHDDPLSLVLLDIDHFKGVNDRFGHQHGDRVLVEAGRRLVAIARRGEAVTRIGGEEFAWILPRTSGDGAEAAASRALLAIAGAPFDGVGTLTISAGVCELSAVGDADEMVRLADQMLYRAKADGRNAVRRHVREGELAGTA